MVENINVVVSHILRLHWSVALTLYLTQTRFNTFSNRAYLDQAAHERAAWSVPTIFAYGNIMRCDPTLFNLTSDFFVQCTKVKVYLYYYS